MTDTSKKTLSIQVSLNGLSFCIYDTSSNTIDVVDHLSFSKKLNPFETLEQLKSKLAVNTHFSQDFESLQIIHYNELATLVPSQLYDEANNAEYLKYNSKILKTDFIASDKLEYENIISVYVPYVNINNYIFETFGTFTYKHASTLFLDAIVALNIINQEDHLFVNLVGETMQLAVFKNNAFQLYNFFEFNSPEDFIYYVLFTCEQKQLNPESVKLYLIGDINTDDNYFTIAYRYIRHVEVIEDSKDFLIKNSF